MLGVYKRKKGQVSKTVLGAGVLDRCYGTSHPTGCVICDMPLSGQEGRERAFLLLLLPPTLRKVAETGDGWVGAEATGTCTGSQVGHTTSHPWF